MRISSMTQENVVPSARKISMGREVMKYRSPSLTSVLQSSMPVLSARRLVQLRQRFVLRQTE